MAGRIVLLLGIVCSGVYYNIAMRNATPSVEELLPGSARAEARQRGILFGPSGALMMEWMDTFTLPSTQAVLIVIVAAVVSAVCFHAARIHDENDSDAG